MLAGCSSTGRAPFGGGPHSRSVAVIGDHPTSAATGEPGARVATETDEIDLAARPSARARISGRVLDEEGRPVPDAQVRLADGVAKGGRDLRTTTDRSGGFTLNGLRPGTNYTLIAETGDDRGSTRGSAEARASETGVEINLASREGVPAARSARPARARSISDRSEPAGDDEAADSADDDGRGPIPSNREDIGRPADEASIDDPPSAGRSRPARARLSAPIPGSGWRKPGSAAEFDASSRPAAAPSRSDDPIDEDELDDRGFDPNDDGPNPLPPAIERSGDDPEQTSARPGRRTKVGARPEASEDGDAGGMRLAASPAGSRRAESSPPPDAATAEPSPSPSLDSRPPPGSLASALPDVPPSAEEGPGLSAEPGGPGLPEMPTLASETGPTADPPPGRSPVTADANPHPASEPVFASEGSAPPPAAPAPAPSPPADYNPFANPFVTQAANDPPPPGPSRSAKSPGPASTIAMDVKPSSTPSPASPPVEPTPTPTPGPVPARKVTWGELAGVVPATPASAVVASPGPAARLRGKARVVSDKKDDAAALCTYDARLHRLVDFRLPDLEGNPVRLKDLDADFILLDFWGTWCKPCVDAVPHLVELQKKFGPGRLKVVGIACEQVDPKERKAKVEEMSRKLGINYAVLLSGMDGPCPLQEALHIQACRP
jgi:thiol-disulfide isomerase/thioredoxin